MIEVTFSKVIQQINENRMILQMSGREKNDRSETVNMCCLHFSLLICLSNV